jgi:chemotaxis protein methyltransferase CheR
MAVPIGQGADGPSRRPREAESPAAPGAAARLVRGGAVDEVETDLLLEAVHRLRGFDFRDYARASLRRRIANQLHAEEVGRVSALLDRVLHDPQAMDRLLLGLSVTVSAMFRDPGFFRALRATVVPLLRTYPFVRVWQAGCSTGEEVYSLAILLEEEGLMDRCRIYATDMNDTVLDRAREGIYPLDLMKKYTQNYIRSGGTRAFSAYYTAAYDRVILRPSLRDRIVFARHNLVTDGTFNEFNLVLCRNVMIYFNRPLQSRVHRLLHASLATFGILGLGAHETLTVTEMMEYYEEVDAAHRLYRRVV